MMRWVSVITCSLVLGSAALAEEELRPNQQAVLLLRILSFDRNLEARANDEVTVAVVYRQNNAESEAVRTEMIRALEDASGPAAGIQLRIKVKRMAYTTAASFESDLAKMRPTAVYVASNLTSQIDSISQATRRLRALTFAADESYVRSGLSVGLIVRDSKPKMLVNLSASRAEGAELSSDMLRLAEVIR